MVQGTDSWCRARGAGPRERGPGRGRAATLPPDRGAARTTCRRSANASARRECSAMRRPRCGRRRLSSDATLGSMVGPSSITAPRCRSMSDLTNAVLPSTAPAAGRVAARVSGAAVRFEVRVRGAGPSHAHGVCRHRRLPLRVLGALAPGQPWRHAGRPGARLGRRERPALLERPRPPRCCQASWQAGARRGMLSATSVCRPAGAPEVGGHACDGARARHDVGRARDELGQRVHHDVGAPARGR